jgi:hypothetical protein
VENDFSGKVNVECADAAFPVSLQYWVLSGYMLHLVVELVQYVIKLIFGRDRNYSNFQLPRIILNSLSRKSKSANLKCVWLCLVVLLWYYFIWLFEGMTCSISPDPVYFVIISELLDWVQHFTEIWFQDVNTENVRGHGRFKGMLSWRL